MLALIDQIDRLGELRKFGNKLLGIHHGSTSSNSGGDQRAATGGANGRSLLICRRIKLVGEVFHVF
jgi:hypothetical protein